MRVSQCCGAYPGDIIDEHGGIDCDSIDLGICPECGETCSYVEEGYPEPDPDEDRDLIKGDQN